MSAFSDIGARAVYCVEGAGDGANDLGHRGRVSYLYGRHQTESRDNEGVMRGEYER